MAEWMREGGSKTTGYDRPPVIFPDRDKPALLTGLEVVDAALAAAAIMHLTAKALASALEVAGRRVPQDIAVTGRIATDPKGLIGRRIGLSAAQNARVQADAQLARLLGAEDVRINQWQVNTRGQYVGVNRPDLQFTLNGRRTYVEYDTEASQRGIDHFRRILANDPDADIWLITMN